MLVICEECGKNYRIDPAKIKGQEAVFKCKACGFLIKAHKPPQDESDRPTPAAADPASNGRKPEQHPAVSAPQKKQPRDPKNKNQRQSLLGARTRFGLSAKLFLMMIFISLIPLALFSSVALKQTKDLIRYEAVKQANRTFTQAARSIDAWFKQKESVLKTLATMSTFTSMDPEKLAPSLVMLKGIIPELSSVFVLDPAGSIIAATGDASVENPSGQVFYRNITGGKAFAWQTITLQPKTRTGLILSAPIRKDRALIGVLAGIFTADAIGRQSLPVDTGDAAFAFLIADGKRIRAHSLGGGRDRNREVQWQYVIDRYRQGERGLVRPASPPADEVLRAVVGETAFGWGIALQTEAKEALSMIDRLVSFASLLLAITVIFVFAIAWFSGRALSRPIIRLTDAAERISVGELDMIIQTSRKDEIGDLAEAIARLQDSIRLSIVRLRRRR